MPTLEDTRIEMCELCRERDQVDTPKIELVPGYLYCPICDRRPPDEEKGLTG